jgi:hypothetical protein
MKFRFAGVSSLNALNGPFVVLLGYYCVGIERRDLLRLVRAYAS